jgi:regulator of protease activity HflC (stomatin/prohibitin superfamily)
LPQAIRILREYERGVIFRLGKLLGAKGPGLILLIPVVDKMVKIDLRVVTIDVAKQEVMTRDNVPVTVDAVVYFRVIDPIAAVVKVENFWKATSLIAQTTLRSVLGQAELDELLSHREKINQTLQEIIDRQTDPWGIKVTAVEVKDVVLPDGMKRAMAKQAEAERERRAKVVNAEGEFQAAEKMVQAAAMMSKEPIALQLRFLQTMREISSEHNTTTFLPVPIDLFGPFLKGVPKG